MANDEVECKKITDDAKARVDVQLGAESAGRRGVEREINRHIMRKDGRVEISSHSEVWTRQANPDSGEKSGTNASAKAKDLIEISKHLSDAGFGLGTGI